jgi:hypothetical protein
LHVDPKTVVSPTDLVTTTMAPELQRADAATWRVTRTIQAGLDDWRSFFLMD